MTAIQKFLGMYSRRRFACLFLSLLVTMTAAPVLAALGLDTKFMSVFLNLNILAAVLITFSGMRFGLYVGAGLLILIFVTMSGQYILGGASLLMAGQGIGVFICVVSIYVMVQYIISGGVVTSERIYAALNVYLMIGITCGLLFCLIEEQWPGALSLQGENLGGNRQAQLAHTIYFSFVTLGTLGYGDIIPVGGPARALAVVEALVGQMYLVVVVAHLVSLYRGSADRAACAKKAETFDHDER